MTVLGLARSGIALARFLADAGARVTVYDGRPADELAEAIAALGGRPVRLALGPDVDPAATWADADARRDLAVDHARLPDDRAASPRGAARRSSTRAPAAIATAPALVSEADLFLRLCPAPTIGVTGTKGKTTTSSLIAALLAADPAHPVVLGGNIGIPLVERLPELTPDHRVVVELSELQLPTLSRGTTVAVYTNVTSDHLDRHGSLEALPAGQAPAGRAGRPGRRARPQRRGPGRRRRTPAPARRADRPLPARARRAGRPRRRRRLDRRRRRRAARARRRRDGRDRARRPDHAASPSWRSRARTTSRTRSPRSRSALAVRHRARRDPRAAAAAFTGVEHRLEPVAIIDGVRFVNDSQGTQPDAVDRRAARLRRRRSC